MMWCVTESLFLNWIFCVPSTVAGFGVNASVPFWPVIVIVTTPPLVAPPPPVVGAVGVLAPPPPPPPQPAAVSATESAAAIVRFLIDLPPGRIADPIGEQRRCRGSGVNSLCFQHVTGRCLTPDVTAYE